MGIGNYIHYDYQNYKTYGLQRTAYRFINENGEIVYRKDRDGNSQAVATPPAAANLIAQKQEIVLAQELARIKTKYSPTTLQKITDKLNFFYGRSYDGQTISKTLKKDMEKVMLTMLEKENKNLKIDFSNLSINENWDIETFYSNINDRQREKLNEVKRISLQTENLYTEVFGHILNFMSLRERLREHGGTCNLIQSIDLLVSKWQEVRYVFAHGGDKSIKEDFISDLKALSNSVNMYNTMEWKGRILEMLVGLQEYALLRGTQVGFDELLEYAQKNFSKLAGEKSQKGLQKSRFSHFIEFDKLNHRTPHGAKRRQILDEFGLWTVNATYNKVDFTLDLDGMKVPISLKNYNLQDTTNIHLLSGKSWIRIVQEYETFVNHYLNIVPMRKGQKTHKTQAPSADVQPMLKAMKLTIFVKAIIGRDVTNQGLTDAAELLVVNDTTPGKTGQLKVYHIFDLYKEAFRHPELIVLNDTINDPNKISNTWVSKKREATNYSSATHERITKMIRTMHNRRVNVQVSKLVLK